MSFFTRMMRLAAQFGPAWPDSLPNTQYGVDRAGVSQLPLKQERGKEWVQPKRDTGRLTEPASQINGINGRVKEKTLRFFVLFRSSSESQGGVAMRKHRPWGER